MVPLSYEHSSFIDGPTQLYVVSATFSTFCHSCDKQKRPIDIIYIKGNEARKSITSRFTRTDTLSLEVGAHAPPSGRVNRRPRCCEDPTKTWFSISWLPNFCATSRLYGCWAWRGVEEDLLTTLVIRSKSVDVPYTQINLLQKLASSWKAIVPISTTTTRMPNLYGMNRYMNACCILPSLGELFSKSLQACCKMMSNVDLWFLGLMCILVAS